MEKFLGMTSMAASMDQDHTAQSSNGQPEHYLPDFDSTLPGDANQIFGQQFTSLSAPIDLSMANSSGGTFEDVHDTRQINTSYPFLPPLTEVQPKVNHYVAHVNSIIPIFSEDAIAQMLQKCYSIPEQRSQYTWAAINIVLALAALLPSSPSSSLDLSSGDGKVATYVNNAQTVLSAIMTHEESILGLQVVLGLVIISHTMKDSRPAVVLIGTAVRLAHRLRLHIKSTLETLSEDEAVQCHRVFWITYLFDKDISLRHHTPPMQSDADIGVDFPPEYPSDNAGIIYTSDGRIRLNFLRLRLQLAHIQGRVYQLLFAVKTDNIAVDERRRRVTLLHYQLEHWRRLIPPEMQADAVVKHAQRTSLFWLSLLQFSYLGCLVMIHGIWSFDTEWRQRLADNLLDTPGGKGSKQNTSEQAPLPKGWKYCVQMSRNCMRMIYQMPLSDCSVW
jgi:hypothetical protein